MYPDGSNQTNLTDHWAADFDPAWSPDGLQLAFVSNRDGNSEIYLMDYDGSNLVNLTNNKWHDANPVWSSDGRRLAFISGREEGLDHIYILDILSGEIAQVPAPEGLSITLLDWLPDSNQIVFEMIFHSGYALYQQNINGLAELHLLALGMVLAVGLYGRRMAARLLSMRLNQALLPLIFSRRLRMAAS